MNKFKNNDLYITVSSFIILITKFNKNKINSFNFSDFTAIIFDFHSTFFEINTNMSCSDPNIQIRIILSKYLSNFVFNCSIIINFNIFIINIFKFIRLEIYTTWSSCDQIKEINFILRPFWCYFTNWLSFSELMILFIFISSYNNNIRFFFEL